MIELEFLFVEAVYESILISGKAREMVSTIVSPLLCIKGASLKYQN